MPETINPQEQIIQVTIDVSMYPFNKEYKAQINDFISKNNLHKDLKIRTFPTSTVLQGGYEEAMEAVKDTISCCNDRPEKAVYVLKVIPDYEAI